MAFDNTSKELKAFYFEISKNTHIMDFSYAVSLGFYKNLNVEAKYSIVVPNKGVLAVSLGSEGLGIFKIENNKNDIKYATLYQQIKSEILNSEMQNEVVNSFTYEGGKFYIAAGEAGIIILSFNNSRNNINSDFLQVEFSVGVSVNSIAKSGNNLAVATTEGLSIYTLSGN